MKIFFEGSIPKPRHAKDKITWDAKINGYLKDYYKLKTKTQPRHLKTKHNFMKRKISEAYGRPPPWLTVLLAKELESRGYAVDYSAEVENDFRICQDALDRCKNQQVVVVGNDSDFIGFSPAKSVTHLVNKFRGKWRTLEKSAVLEKFQVSDFELALIFAICGTDNVQAHVKNIGFSKALKFVKSRKFSLKDFMKLDAVPLNSKKDDIKRQMALEFKLVLRNFGWLDYRIVPQELPKPVFPQKSEFMVFVEDEQRSSVRNMLNNQWTPKDRGKRRKMPPKLPKIYDVENTFSILRFLEETKKVYDKGITSSFIHKASHLIDIGLFSKDKDSEESNEDDEKEKEGMKAFESGSEGVDEKAQKQSRPKPTRERKGKPEERAEPPQKRNKSQGSGTTDWMRTIPANTRKNYCKKYEMGTVIMGGLATSVQKAVSKTIPNPANADKVTKASYS